MELCALMGLLLPIAAVSGWLAARRSHRQSAAACLSSDYLRGVNYLLNEQPDKALDVFIKLIDVDSETVETHLALGALFRRRGEVNRAIRIHQNLAHKAQLNPQQRDLALLELGQDYQRAGLLDRAEDLYRQLAATGPYQVYACRQLLDIYQQEHDWEKARHAARQLAAVSGDNLNPVIAQHYCEQAEIHRKQDQVAALSACLQHALQADPQCVRASLMQSQQALAQARFAEAAVILQRVEQQDPLYLSEIIAPLQQCYQATGKLEEFSAWLKHILEHHDSTLPMLEWVCLLREQEGEAVACAFMIRQLRRRPSIRGIACLMDMALSENSTLIKENFLVIKDLMRQMLKNHAAYKCLSCGFSGKTLHWQCPSCKQWNSVKPLQGIDAYTGR